MSVDRYTKALLTLIAVELGWIAVMHTAPAAQAQAQPPTPVVITGIELRNPVTYLPVAVVGGAPFAPAGLGPVVTRASERPMLVQVAAPVEVRAIAPVTVQTERPLRVESVGFTPASRPGR